jgi:hypothetical protein
MKRKETKEKKHKIKIQETQDKDGHASINYFQTKSCMCFLCNKLKIMLEYF